MGKGNVKKPAGNKPATTTQAPTWDVDITMRAKKKKKGKKGKVKKPAGKKPAAKKPATTTQAPTTTVEAFDGPEEVTLVFTIEPPPVTNLKANFVTGGGSGRKSPYLIMRVWWRL